MTAIAERYRHLSADVTSRVDAVPAERWDDPSPCPDWTARDVLGHVLETHAAMLANVGVPTPASPVVGLDPAAAWATVRDTTQAALDDPEQANRIYDGHFGRMPLDQAMDAFLCFDLLIHSWDIAKATGVDERLDAGEVTRVFADARKMGGILRAGGVCGPEVEAPEQADEQSAMLAYLGRRP